MGPTKLSIIISGAYSAHLIRRAMVNQQFYRACKLGPNKEPLNRPQDL